MTISSIVNRNDYVGNGATATYSYTFKIFEESDLLVTVTDTSDVETPLILTTDYTVAGEGETAGGSITLVGGNLASGSLLTIRRFRPITQETDIRNQGAFYPESHEDAFDHFIMVDQQQQDELDRALKTSENDEQIGTLPLADDRANQFLAFDASGDPIAASTVTGVVASSYAQTLLDDTSAQQARGTLGFTGTSNKVALAADVSGTLPIANGGTGQVTANAGFNALSPMTTGGDLIYGGASGVGTRLANGSSGQYLKSAGGTSAPVWTTFTTPTIQTFTTGSGTYTTPANVRWIRVSIVGGGGGGGAGGTTASSSGAAGGNSTFGSSLLTANGGAAGANLTSGGAAGGVGGTATISAPAIGKAFSGGMGGGTTGSTGVATPGGAGGDTIYGGSGRSNTAATGGAGAANTGSGGAGGATTASAGTAAGGGGAGGAVLAIIPAPSATYAYAVGAGGAGGISTANGSTGGAGAAGGIIVEEYYV